MLTLGQLPQCCWSWKLALLELCSCYCELGWKANNFSSSSGNWEVGPFLLCRFMQRVKWKGNTILLYNTGKDPEVMCPTARIFQLSRWRNKSCGVAMGSCQMPRESCECEPAPFLHTAVLSAGVQDWVTFNLGSSCGCWWRAERTRNLADCRRKSCGWEVWERTGWLGSFQTKQIFIKKVN